MPMDREAKKEWSWVDWMRFLFYRQFFCNKREHLMCAVHMQYELFARSCIYAVHMSDRLYLHSTVLQPLLIPGLPDPAVSAGCRHYTDLLLIAVVALCTVENDVIHAAYLALALLLFRRRDALRRERQHLFKWLPLYNFLVMLVTLAYQAPFNSAWDHHLRPYLVSCLETLYPSGSSPRASKRQQRLPAADASADHKYYKSLR